MTHVGIRMSPLGVKQKLCFCCDTGRLSLDLLSTLEVLDMDTPALFCCWRCAGSSGPAKCLE